MTAGLVLVLAMTLPERAVASTAWVRAGREGVGTGWVASIDPPRVVTCAHVVGEAIRVEVVFSVLGDADRIANEADQSGWRKGRVVARSAAHDLALIELDALPKSTRPVTRFAFPRVGGELISVGCREDAVTLWNVTRGTLGQRGRLSEPYFARGIRYAAGRVGLFADLPAAGGDSGGPAFDAFGRLVGMVAASASGEVRQAWVIPSRDVLAWLKIADPVVFACAEMFASDAPQPSWDRVVCLDPDATAGRRAGLAFDDWVCTPAKGLIVGQRIEVQLPITAGNWPAGDPDDYIDDIAEREAGRRIDGLVLAIDAGRRIAWVRLRHSPKFASPIRLADREAAVGEKAFLVQHLRELCWVASGVSLRQRQNAERRDWWQAVPSRGGGGVIFDRDGKVLGLLEAVGSGDRQLAGAIPASLIAASKTWLDARPPDRDWRMRWRWIPGIADYWACASAWLARVRSLGGDRDAAFRAPGSSPSRAGRSAPTGGPNTGSC